MKVVRIKDTDKLDICPKCKEIIEKYIEHRMSISQSQRPKCFKRAVPNVSSKYKGVNYDEHLHRWRARITYISPKTKRKSMKHLGFFPKEKQAAFAYDIAAKEKYGKYAKLNQDMYPDDFKNVTEENWL